MIDDRPWHILTGEYPPQRGGVADYTALVAEGLAARGVPSHIWAPSAESVGPEPSGVTVHREAGTWSPADLRHLGSRLDAYPTPRRLLVQYTPNAWGYKGLNLGFCRWLRSRRRAGDEVRTMIHEPAYPFRLRDKPTRLVLAVGHRLMLRTIIRASNRLDHSMEAIGPYLRFYGDGQDRPTRWLPVPSNVPEADDPAALAALRTRVAPRGEAIVGSFGTFSWSSDRALRTLLPRLLAGREDRVGLLIGRGSDRFAADLLAAHPGLAERLTATGGLAPRDASLHLQAVDVLLQPYVDGVSARRGSMMAGVAHGRAIVTNDGWNTEPDWAASGGVAIAPLGDLDAFAEAADRLLADPAARARIGTAARSLYDRRFALERTIEALAGDER